MPVAACSVSRLPAGSSQESYAPLVSTTSVPFDTSSAVRFRSSSRYTPDAVSPRLFPARSPPRLLNAAAGGGLKPPPERRLRGAFPHLHHSTVRHKAKRSWHTIGRYLSTQFLSKNCLTLSRPGRRLAWLSETMRALCAIWPRLVRVGAVDVTAVFDKDNPFPRGG